MFQKKTLMVGFIVVALGLAFGTFLIRSNHKQQTKKVEASSATSIITTQADWQAGNGINIDSTSSPGSIKLNTSFTQIDLQAIYNADPSRVTADVNSSQKTYVFDGNAGTAWTMGPDAPPPQLGTWKIDLGTVYNISRVEGQITNAPEYTIVGSTDDVTYNDLCYLNYLNDPCDVGPTVPARYVKAYRMTDDVLQFGLNELRLYYSNASAIHTTGATQIDGGANFWQWESFADTKTVPANTSVIYRYRTSSDSTTWTSWVSDIGSVTSRVGDTKYRYLQVEATLANTDGASTPTIDQYDIGYHTEQKPNKPTAQTAVIQ